MARDRLIQLWWTRIPESGADLEQDRKILSDDELERADRFLVDDSRRCFVTARAMLRHVLGNATGIDPVDIRFDQGKNGKPHLANPHEPAIFFNLTHSGPFVALVLCHENELGVDIEVVRPMKSAQRLANRFFSKSESEHLQTITKRDHAFFHLWTCKEAYLKAIGTGLTAPLRSVEISPFDEGPPRILSIKGSTDEAVDWSLLRPFIDATAICTVAIKGSGYELSIEPKLSDDLG